MFCFRASVAPVRHHFPESEPVYARSLRKAVAGTVASVLSVTKLLFLRPKAI
jgi:hypothetical protein